MGLLRRLWKTLILIGMFCKWKEKLPKEIFGILARKHPLLKYLLELKVWLEWDTEEEVEGKVTDIKKGCLMGLHDGNSFPLQEDYCLARQIQEIINDETSKSNMRNLIWLKALEDA